MSDLTDPLVTTDQTDYAPGSTATITASGFGIGDDLQFIISVIDPVTHATLFAGPIWTVADGSSSDLDPAADGSVVTQLNITSAYAGATIELTVVDLTSGQTATDIFTDSGPDAFDPPLFAAAPSNLFDIRASTASFGPTPGTNGAVYQATSFKSASGVLTQFQALQTDGSEPTEMAYNTSFDKNHLSQYNDFKIVANFTPIVMLDHLVVVNGSDIGVGSGTFYEFAVANNQNADAALTALQIWQGHASNYNIDPSINATTHQVTLPNFLTADPNGKLDFDMNGGPSGATEILLSHATGNSTGEAAVYVPTGDFGSSATFGNFIYLFSAFGQDPNNPTSSGFEQWAAFEVAGTPAWTVTKAALSATPNDLSDTSPGSPLVDHAGEVITYEVKVANTGTEALTNVVVNDPLGGGTLVLTSSSDGVTAQLDIGATWTYDYTYTVTQTDMDHGDVGGALQDQFVHNTATATSNELPATQASTLVPIDQDPSFILHKIVLSAPPTTGTGLLVDHAGELVTYQVSITNNGNIDLTNVHLSDPLLQGGHSTLTGFSETGGSDPSDPGDDTGSNFEGHTLDVGETWTLTYVYTAQQSDIDNDGNPGGDGFIHNTVTATNDETSSQQETAIVAVIDRPAWDIAKAATVVGETSHKIEHAGDVVDYTVTIHNAGNETLTGVDLKDSLEGALGVDLNGPTSSSDSVTTQLDVGQTWTWTYAHTVTQTEIDTNGGNNDGTLDNVATATSNQIPTETSSSAGVPIDYHPAWDIAKAATVVGETSHKVEHAGDVIDYTVTLHNDGNVTLTGVDLKDSLEGGAANELGGPTSSSDSITTQLDVGQTWTWTYAHTVSQTDIDSNGGNNDGTIDNVATATSTQVTSTSSSASVPVDYHPAWDIAKAATVVGETSHKVEHAGDVIDYTVTLHNDGNVTLSGVDLKDSLEGATGIDLNGPTSSSDSITTQLDVGQTWTWTYAHTVSQTDIDSNGGNNDGTIDNVATATSTQVTSTSSSASVPVDYHPAWDIAKAATVVGETSHKVEHAGDVIDYTVTLHNDGNVTLTGVDLKDSLEGGAANELGGPTSSSDSVTTQLDVGQTWTWTYAHTVSQTDIDSNGGNNDGTIDNVATATSTQVTSTSSSAGVPIDYHPAWDIAKAATVVGETSHKVEHAGDVIDYTVTLHNDGNVTLTGVDLKDSLEGATGIDLNGPTSSSDSITTQLDVGQTWTWTYAHTVSQTDIDSNGGNNDGTIDNVATATSTQVTSTSSSASVPVDYHPAWDIAKAATVVGETSHKVEHAGDVIDYTVTLHNDGNVTLSGIDLKDSLEGGAANELGGPTSSSDSVTTQLDVGQTWTWTYAHTVTQTEIDTNGGDHDGTIDNVATATSTQVTSTSSSASVPVDYHPAWDIAKAATVVGETSHKVEHAGDVIDYTVTLHNDGNVTLSGIDLKDALEGGAANELGGPTSSSDSVTTQLDVGQTWTWTYAHTVSQTDIDSNGGNNDGTIDNVATATSTQVTSTSSSASVPVDYHPAWDIAKAATVVGETSGKIEHAGDVIDYTVTLHNDGNVTLSGIDLKDALEGGAANELGGPTSSSDSVTTQLDVGQTWTWTYAHTVTQTEIDTNGGDHDGTIDNIATATSTQVTSTSSSASVPVDYHPAWDIAKAATVVGETSGKIEHAGDVIDYTVTLHNDGNVTLTGVDLKDSLEGGAANELGGPTSSSDSITTQLDVGQTWTWTYAHTVSQTDIDSNGGNNDGTIDNVATATSTQVTSTSSSASVPVDYHPAWDIAKAATVVGETSGKIEHAGDVIDYTVTLHNDGNVTLSGIDLKDALEGGAANELGGPTSSSDSVTTQLDVGQTWTWTYAHTVTQTEIDTNGGDHDGTIDNVATATSTQVTSTSSSASVPVDYHPAWDIAKAATVVGETSGKIEHAGDVIDYTVTLLNDGNVTLSGIDLKDALEGGAANELGGPTSSSDSITTQLDVGQTWTWTYAHTVTQTEIDTNGGDHDGTIDNIATATSTQVTSTSSSASVPVDYNPEWDIAKAATVVGETSGKIEHAGDVIDYTVTLHNDGNVTLSGIDLKDALEGGAANELGGPTSSSDSVTTQLDVGQTWTWTYAHTVTQSEIDTNGGDHDGTIDNIATATSTQVTSTSSSASVPVDYNPEWDIAKAATVVGETSHKIEHAGDVIDYTVTIHNAGDVTLTGVDAKDSLEGATGIDLNGPTSSSNSDTTQIDPGATWTWTYAHTVTQTEIDTNGVDHDGTLDNLVTATSNQISIGTSSASVPIDYNPEWDIHKVATVVGETSHKIEHAGDVVDYTVTIHNNGDVTLTGVDLKDSLEGATGVDLNGPTSSSNSDTTQIDPGATWTWTYAHTVTQTEIDSNGGDNDGTLDNLVTATSNQISIGTSSASVPIDYNPEINIEKLVSVDYNPNNPGAAHWFVTNDDTHTVGGVTMTDVQYLEFLFPNIFSSSNLAAGTPSSALTGTVSYEVVVNNFGDVTLHDVTVTDVPALPTPGFVLADTDFAPGQAEISNVVSVTVGEQIISGGHGGGKGGFKTGHVAEPAAPTPGTNIDMTQGATETTAAGGAIWANQGTNLETIGASGTGVFNTFSRLQNNGSEQGFNTDANHPALDEKASIHTHSLQLSTLQAVDANGLPASSGTTYYEFKLDINQSGASPYLSLNQLLIYQDGTPALNTLAGVEAGHLAYNLDGTGDHTVLLNASLGAGSGSGGGVVDNADLIVLVPTADFVPADGNYIYLYSVFGTSAGGWAANGGFEEWGALTPMVTTVSDTATVTATAGDNGPTVSDSDTASFIGPAAAGPVGESKTFWSSHAATWDGTTSDDGTWVSQLFPDVTSKTNVLSQGSDLNPSGTSLTLGDVDHNLATHEAYDFQVSLSAAQALLSTTPAPGDFRVPFASQLVAAQLNDYNHQGHEPNGLIEAAVKWLTTGGTPSNFNLVGGNVDTTPHDGTLNPAEYSVSSSGVFSFTSPVPSGSAWTKMVEVLDASNPSNYEHVSITADGAGLLNALQAYNNNSVVVSIDGQWIGWSAGGSVTDVHQNQAGVFWDILYDHHVGGISHI